MVEKTYRFRVLMVAFFSMLPFLAIEARLFHLQVRQHDAYVTKARNQQYLIERIYPKRGDILDREGQTLATSTSFQTVYFSPPPSRSRNDGDEPPAWRQALTPDLIEDLAQLLDMDEDRIRSVLDRNRGARLVNKVPPETAQAVRLLLSQHRVPRNLFFLEEQSKRLYPTDELAGPILGFAGDDPYGENIGLEGLEFLFNDLLAGALTTQTLQITNRHGELEALDDGTVRKAYGNTLVLTLDSQIQLAARQALARQMTRVEAESGVVVVMEVKTGDILAMVSLPDFDPNTFQNAKPGSIRNRSLTDPIEIGSVMKILTTAVLLDNNLLGVDELVDCKNGYAVIDGRTFRDSHPQGIVPFRLAFAESSNIAMAVLGLRLEPSLYYESLRRFGLGSPVGIDLPGESGGVLRPVSQWSRLSRTSLPVGYETSMTALQVVTAVGAIANGGLRMQPRIVSRVLSVEGRLIEEFPTRAVAQVAGPETSRTVLDLMAGVVEEGTGKKARVPGYSVGGKTGTTRKHTPERRYIASFAGVIPARNPELVIYCFVNEPNRKIDFYGGSIAAPVFAEVAAEAVRILGVPPDQPRPVGDDALRIADARSSAPMRLADSVPPDADADEFVEGVFETPPVDGDPEPAVGTADWATALSLLAGDVGVRAGEMPHCLGLTMSEVLRRGADAGLPIKMVGTGIAIQQSPPPGTPMAAGRQAIVVFAPPSQAVVRGGATPDDAGPVAAGAIRLH